MDNVTINITETPNSVSLNITDNKDNITINILECASASCAQIASCQVIIDLQQDVLDHVNDNANPHNVTKAQVGLANVDNTSDLNKPISTAQQSALNLKEDVVNKATNFNAPDNITYPTTQATIDLVDNRVQSNIKIIGDWDATSGSMPLADESNTTPFITQWGSTIKVGWAFRVGYGQAGTVGGFEYEEGDVVYALIDNAGPTPADWGDLDHNLQQATESLRGTAKVITAAIIADENTLDDEKFVTGKKLWLNFWNRVLAIAHTFAAKITFTSAPRFSSVTASHILKVDTNKDLTSVLAPSGDLLGTSDQQTITNKTIKKRILVVTQAAQPTTNIDNADIVQITGLAQAITSMSANLTGTPYDGQMIMWQITDNGTARAITWGASFASTTNFTLPTTTVLSTMLRVLTQYNEVTGKHECIAT